MNLNLIGGFAAAVDETGAMNYHPYKEVFDMMDEVAKLREEILLSCKLDAPTPCRLDAPDFGFVCHVLADCLHQHLQVI